MEESEEQRHYETLVKVFKYLITTGIGIGAIFVGVAAYLIGNNLSDVNRKTDQAVQNFNEEIRIVKSESDQAIRDRREEADRQMDNFRKNMETFLNFSRDVTQMEMTTATETAKNLALSSAKERIEEAFKANNVQLLVDSAARKEVQDRLNSIVQETMKKTETTFDQFATLISLVDRIRAVDRTAVDALDSLAHSSDDPNVRREAYYLLLQKGKDYDNSVDSLTAHHILQSIALKQLGMADTELITGADTVKVRSALEDLILKSPDLYKVTNAFMALRKLTGADIETFDITLVKNLRKQNQ
ncbi:MAG: hypothetical protein WAO19_06845 [Candidatus Kryptoniota bacterium]